VTSVSSEVNRGASGSVRVSLTAPPTRDRERACSLVALVAADAAIDGPIRGAVRADYFWGFGPQAGREAGRMLQDGRMWLLWPKGADLAQ